jgi:hypothetical protein
MPPKDQQQTVVEPEAQVQDVTAVEPEIKDAPTQQKDDKNVVNQPEAVTSPAREPIADMPVVPTTDGSDKFASTEELKSMKEEISGFRDLLSGLTETLQKSKAAEDGKVGGLTKELNKTKEELQKKEAVLNRQTLLIQEFPDLLEFEVLGALPTGDDVEKLRPVLQSFKNILDARGKVATEQKISGSVPPAPVNQAVASGADWTEDKLYAQLQDLAGKEDAKSVEEFQKLQKIWDENKFS